MCRLIKTTFCVIFLLPVFLLIDGKIIVFEDDRRIDEFHSTELPYSLKKVDDDLHDRTGVILLANPPDACAPILGPPEQNSSLNWFVLIAGNLCDYVTKVSNAQSAGFSAAIIYTLRGSSVNANQKIYQGYLPNITAVLVRTNAGIIIKENYLYTINKRFWILMTPNQPSPKWKYFLQKYRLLLATFLFLVIILVIPIGILKYVQRSHAMQNSILNTSHLEQLETAKFKTGDPYETCAICLEDFKVNEKLRILPCCHAYHATCIDQWLTENRRICPMCKKQVNLNQESAQAEISAVTNNQSETTPLLNSEIQRSAPPPDRSFRTLSNAYQGRLHTLPFNIRQTSLANHNNSV
ncbi:E3 ubiquitin-protein ligase RNF13 isoform X1 [Parasteatoda tepidariorum]|uniref:E3 ubiquitin-protein ligase RNF13 isoform X1 n=1 Tax=Parasteatoda tepidariorum TaxID=114398 RepID=UPI00077F83CB|nr:E3 ubiquitin-protein ligase RNF13 isoform X1 [Parasteatoda tepidariorum]